MLLKKSESLVESLAVCFGKSIEILCHLENTVFITKCESEKIRTQPEIGEFYYIFRKNCHVSRIFSSKSLKEKLGK